MSPREKTPWITDQGVSKVREENGNVLLSFFAGKEGRLIRLFENFGKKTADGAIQAAEEQIREKARGVSPAGWFAFGFGAGVGLTLLLGRRKGVQTTINYIYGGK